MLSEWVTQKLETLKTESLILLRDSLRLLPESDVHQFANENGFTVVEFSTNLAFRDLFERISISKEVKKLIILDRAPVRRTAQTALSIAPPPFYPDLLYKIPDSARLDISLRQFLIDITGDPNWPQECNASRFARLIIGSLEGVLKAHSSLRAAHQSRFTDHDFKTIVAYAALGAPEAAFKLPEAGIYWKVALLGNQALEELYDIAPEVACSIREELRSAPPPFCWFADHQPEPVVRAFYLATILTQHFDHWKLLLTSIEPDLKPFSDMEAAFIKEAALKLVLLDPVKAHKDLCDIEASLSKDALNIILLEQMKIDKDGRFVKALENERYSVMIRSLALLLALDNILSDTPIINAHERVASLLPLEPESKKDIFIEQRTSATWEKLKEAYNLVQSIRKIKDNQSVAIKNLKVMKTADLSFEWFWSLWNDQRVNRLEYYLSALERLVFSVELLPLPADNLPAVFLSASERIKERMGLLRNDIVHMLDDLNRRFQELVAAQYRTWVIGDCQIRLTSQFLRRCVKPHWDAESDKAVVFVFDGMRYDIWDELVRPIFEETMEIIADYHAASLLPSETHISRKAIFAGDFPDSFDTRKGEHMLLKGALNQEFAYDGEVEVVTPEGMATGQTVQYRAGNIDFYIFELCDKELHKIQVKTLPDGRCVPGRPLAFIYQQHIKDIADTEVMAIIRNLAPDTKVFVVADHGFAPVGRERIAVDMSWLNEPSDCSYQNASLREKLEDTGAHRKVRNNTLEFSVADLRMPEVEDAYDRSVNQRWQKKFAAIIFPKTGYALARPKAHFNPDAYSHGGISIQEMLVPMVAMRVKTPEEDLVMLGVITGKNELIEGQEAEFRLQVKLSQSHKTKDVRIEAHAAYQNREETASVPHQVQYLSAPGGEIVFRFIPDAADASVEERKSCIMVRTLRIQVIYHGQKRMVRKTRTFKFSLRLNPEKIVRRVPAHLGKILGLTPKSMR